MVKYLHILFIFSSHSAQCLLPCPDTHMSHFSHTSEIFFWNFASLFYPTITTPVQAILTFHLCYYKNTTGRSLLVSSNQALFYDCQLALYWVGFMAECIQWREQNNSFASWSRWVKQWLVKQLFKQLPLITIGLDFQLNVSMSWKLSVAPFPAEWRYTLRICLWAVGRSSLQEYFQFSF